MNLKVSQMSSILNTPPFYSGGWILLKFAPKHHIHHCNKRCTMTTKAIKHLCSGGGSGDDLDLPNVEVVAARLEVDGGEEKG